MRPSVPRFVLVRRRAGAALIVGWALLFANCGDHATAPPAPTNFQIVSGLENGWAGSGHEIRVGPVVAERDSWAGRGAPHTTATIRIDTATRTALVAAVDESALGALPEVIGCPGCTDGPMEWIEVQRGAFHRRVTFSPWDDLGAGNAALLQQVRTLRAD